MMIIVVIKPKDPASIEKINIAIKLQLILGRMAFRDEVHGEDYVGYWSNKGLTKTLRIEIGPGRVKLCERRCGNVEQLKKLKACRFATVIEA
ncbi:hypothetical protein RhiTH_011092 [Rhizoctonia solani]